MEAPSDGLLLLTVSEGCGEVVCCDESFFGFVLLSELLSFLRNCGAISLRK